MTKVFDVTDFEVPKFIVAGRFAGLSSAAEICAKRIREILPGVIDLTRAKVASRNKILQRGLKN